MKNYQTVLGATYGLLLLWTSQANAQVNEAALDQAVRGLGAQWQAVAQSGAVLVMGCANNTFRGIRARPGTTVTGVDARRTESIMNPYLVIVRLRGEFETNDNDSPSVGCYRTQAQAKREVNWAGNDMTYELEVYYTVQGSELWLNSGNPVFQNNFMRQYGKPHMDPDDPWLKVFRYPIGVQ